MNSCPIFQTFSAARDISIEIDQLIDDIIARLRKADPDLFKNADDQNWVDCLPDENLSWIETGGTLTLDVTVKKGAGAPKLRYLSFRFDLYRTPEESSWPHASDALMVIGYSPLKERPWENLLAVSAQGRLRDDEGWSACKANRHAEGRLLQYSETGLPDGLNWAGRPWLFAIPLRSLENPTSVEKQIVQPIINFLVKNESPENSLAETSAITWAK